MASSSLRMKERERKREKSQKVKVTGYGETKKKIFRDFNTIECKSKCHEYSSKSICEGVKMEDEKGGDRMPRINSPKLKNENWIIETLVSPPILKTKTIMIIKVIKSQKTGWLGM